MATVVPNPDLERELKRLVDVAFWYGTDALEEEEKPVLLEHLIETGQKIGPLWAVKS